MHTPKSIGLLWHEFLLEAINLDAVELRFRKCVWFLNYVLRLTAIIHR